MAGAQRLFGVAKTPLGTLGALRAPPLGSGIAVLEGNAPIVCIAGIALALALGDSRRSTPPVPWRAGILAMRFGLPTPLSHVMDRPWVYPTLLGLAFLLSAAFVGVDGDFPLNDDFAYAYSTRTYLETGRFERLAWTYTPIVSHVALGVLASKLLGFSFVSLRLSTLLMGLLGVLGTYALCRKLSVSRPRSALAAACLAWNPIYFSLSFTFMTDVPFTALIVWGQVCALHYLEQRRTGWLLATLALGAAATLSRQTGLALFAAVAISALVGLPPARRWQFARFLIAFALGLLLVDAVLEATLTSQHYFTLRRAVVREFSAYAPAFNAISVATYLGGFLAPCVLLQCARRLPFGPERPLGLLAWVAVVVAFGLYGIKRLELGLPPGRNVIMNVGIGPRGMHGQALLPHTSALSWWIVSGLCLASFALFVAWLAQGAWARLAAVQAQATASAPLLSQHLLPLSFAIIFLAPHLPRLPLFDRYLIVLVPGLLAVLLSLPVISPAGPPRGRTPWLLGAGLSAVGLFGFAVLATHDYMTHERARWALIRWLEARGVTSMELDGGFEYLALRNYTPDPVGKLSKATDKYWLNDDRYLVTFHPSLSGYTTLVSRNYPRFLPPGCETLYVLRRDETP